MPHEHSALAVVQSFRQVRPRRGKMTVLHVPAARSRCSCCGTGKPLLVILAPSGERPSNRSRAFSVRPAATRRRFDLKSKPPRRRRRHRGDGRPRLREEVKGVVTKGRLKPSSTSSAAPLRDDHDDGGVLRGENVMPARKAAGWPASTPRGSTAYFAKGLLSSATAKVFMAPAKRLLRNMMAVTLSACVCVLGSAWMHAAPPPERELACPGRAGPARGGALTTCTRSCICWMKCILCCWPGRGLLKWNSESHFSQYDGVCPATPRHAPGGCR